eukprot:CAMPEP_0203914722 /NCGR_PEP_ID=MMETSP0359-20131031/55588_1 /ASSEMBLY_ACC=CAM_ASM_000338 /TAXON_ID=268821 /ORGANISM="Scrippsiella Hangoei, Strain SHTV-5" /LENGTH=109 /DNA_ID=CAMNT_0050841081 /DNA_START=279 /DNA_END=605 /DNA_ORIENTATION=-
MTFSTTTSHCTTSATLMTRICLHCRPRAPPPKVRKLVVALLFIWAVRATLSSSIIHPPLVGAEPPLPSTIAQPPHNGTPRCDTDVWQMSEQSQRPVPKDAVPISVLVIW